MAATKKPASTSKPRRPPATTPEARENQLISLAVTLAEKQLAEGTASSQVITHYLKLATVREKLEQTKLDRENELLRARVDQIANSAKAEALYEEAIQAMRSYAGQLGSQDDED